MNRGTVLFLAMMAGSTLFAQNGIEKALAEIEVNNTTLKAMQKSVEAQKKANHADNTLADPELGVNRLWGNPSSIGNRTDISVSQEFDFPTITGAKTKVAKRRDDMVDWQYKSERCVILLEANKALIDAIYYNRYIAELERRMTHANAIYLAQKRSLETGASNKLELNNVSLSLSQITTEMKKAEAEQQAVMTQLARLNGGQTLKVADTVFIMPDLPSDFDSWYNQVMASHPTFGFAESQTAMTRSQLSAVRQSALPSISLGYMSEKTMGEQFQGLTVGLSVPLWSSGRRIRQAKRESEAADAVRDDAKGQLHGILQERYFRAKGLVEAVETSKKALAEADNSQLLAKALKAGEISVVEYLVGLSYYYDAIDNVLSTERECQKACAELTDFLL